jgi:hypothetical protein
VAQKERQRLLESGQGSADRLNGEIHLEKIILTPIENKEDNKERKQLDN